MLYIAIALFAIIHILMLTFSKYRPYIALASGVVFIVAGMLPVENIIGEQDFNVLLMIAGIGILRKEGYEVKNGDFFKIGIPFTLAAIVPAYIYIWLIYGM